MEESRGYLYVATLSRAYYQAMVGSIQSLKDEIPHAQVAVFTHEDWIEDEHRPLFDHLYTPVPVHCRTKLWALDKTPFDLTMYVDADSYVVSPELEEPFGFMEPDVDLLMTENRPYNSKVVYFTEDNIEGPGIPSRELEHYVNSDIELIRQGKGHKFRWHCGMFVYRKNEKTQKLWSEWLRIYRKHNETQNGHLPYPKSLTYWDTFAFWRALHDNPDLGINVQRLPNDAKYNFVTGYKTTELRPGTEIALNHYTIPPEWVKETLVNETGINLIFGSFDRFR
jgi:hypothetical protein